jgi:hypothetical protein
MESMIYLSDPMVNLNSEEMHNRLNFKD